MHIHNLNDWLNSGVGSCSLNKYRENIKGAIELISQVESLISLVEVFM